MNQPLMAILAAFIISVCGNVAQAETGGTYSSNASPIWDKVANAPGHQVRISSPDGGSAATATFIDSSDGLVRITTSGRIGKGRFDIGPGVGAELLWSPDSKAFFVTTSDEGGNGHYRTVVVRAGTTRPSLRDLSPLVERTFGHPVTCGWLEAPNVGGISWDTNSHNVIVAAEIVSHSNCDSFGTFRAYEIDDRHLKILRSFGQLEAKRLFKNALGEELRAAPDDCIRSPQSCWVSTNHPAITPK